MAAMLTGLALQLPSVGLLVAAQMVQSLTILLIGNAVAGAAVSLGFRGSLQGSSISLPRHSSAPRSDSP